MGNATNTDKKLWDHFKSINKEVSIFLKNYNNISKELFNQSIFKELEQNVTELTSVKSKRRNIHTLT